MIRRPAAAAIVLLGLAGTVRATEPAARWEPGEQLDFVVHLGPIREAARTRIEVIPAATDTPGTVRLRAEVEAGSLFETIYPFHYVLLATARAGEMMPVHTSRQMNENGQTSLMSLRFDHEGGRVRVIEKADGPVVTLPIHADTRDLLTALFHIRTLGGEGDEFTVFENHLYEVRFSPPIRESVQVPAGSFKAVRYTVRVLGGDEETPVRDLRLWMSADSRRLPLRLQASTLLGELTAELGSWQEPETARAD